MNFTCLSVNYTKTSVNNVLSLVENYLELENGTVTRPGRADSVAVIGEINPAQPIPAIQSLYHTPPGSNETVNSHTVILASDEESWALAYSCGERDGLLLERISVWSRERSLNPVILKVLDTVAYGIGFPYSHFENIHQTNCVL
ncbi:unnamed protein product [Allacma fusca]|uniref:Uncharacterized protein n=1 Tax=Allacma fusca TaxID=39272 RepID=A0A8J2P236_9HEXA|nr:unnamed protein product [Allacma fusca]